VRTLHRLIVAVLVGLLLAACSKSKSSDNTGTSAAPSANWDSIVWDQGNWS